MAWDRDSNYRPTDAPGVTFFRVLVMLSCLILVPLAAIFGSAFPELVKTAVVDRLKTLAGIEVEGTRPSHNGSQAASTEAPAFGGASIAPAYAPPPAAAPNSYSTGVSSATMHEATAASAVALPSATPPVSTAGAWEPAPRSITPPPAPVTPPVAEYRGQSAEPAPAYSPPANLGEQPPHSTTDYFTEIQQRLRQYGATHYALETSGERGELYRFHCSLDPQRKFEAIDRDPLQAMANVLKQVEAWRSSQSTPSYFSSGFGR